MSVLVQSEDDLADFELFILNNDGRYRTNLSILNAYKKYKLSHSKMSQLDFVEVYQTSNIEGKQKCLEKLLNGYIDKRWVLDLERKLDTGDTTLANFYSAWEENPSIHIRKLILESILLTKENLFW
jgi:hypothetical protein